MKTFIKNLLRKSINAFLPCTLFLTGCAAAPQPETDTFFAMDTVMDFSIYGDAALLSETQALIADLEAAVSVTNPDSSIYAINQNGTGTLNGNAAELMQNALALCRRTNGILDLSHLSHRARLGLYNRAVSGSRRGNPASPPAPR